MNVVPEFARCLIEREQLKTKVPGLIIPQEAAKRNAMPIGKLVACGPTCEERIKGHVGKTVLFGRFAGDWLKLPDGNEIYVCQEEDILAVIE